MKIGFTLNELLVILVILKCIKRVAILYDRLNMMPHELRDVKQGLLIECKTAINRGDVDVTMVG